MNPKQSVEAKQRLSRLLQFLEADPENLRLLEDAAAAAFEAHDLAQANDLIARRANAGPLPNAMANLSGLTAIAQERYQDAISIFEALRQGAGDDPALRFNIAWSKAMINDWQGALDLLDDATLDASPGAPALKIQMLHHLDRYDEALACGEILADRYPDNQALMGALATLAMDAEKADLAALYAQKAGENDEGRTVRGYLALAAYDPRQSADLFDEAVRDRPDNPRAWIGKGLGSLMAGDPQAGAKAIDRGAEIFKDHIGSWVASGWAHFLSGDYDKARSSFDRALAIDDTFAESHGGLAVIDVLQGRTEEAAHRCQVAVRLDKACFGAALARSLLLEKGGHPEMARKIREIAMSTPVGPKGETLAQAIVSFGMGRPR